MKSSDDTVPTDLIANDVNLDKVTGYEGARKQILIVDDVAANRRMLSDLFSPLVLTFDRLSMGLMRWCRWLTPRLIWS